MKAPLVVIGCLGQPTHHVFNGNGEPIVDSARCPVATVCCAEIADDLALGVAAQRIDLAAR
jgi:hypothetical protein